MAEGTRTIKIYERTHPPLKRLAAATGETMMDLIDRLVQEEAERKTMKHIKVGKTNDLHMYAVEADGRYYPLNESDLDFEKPGVKIYYDSGVYPGITLEELPQYICDKAKNMAD